MPDNFDAFAPALKEGFLFEPIPEGCILFEESTGRLITLNAAAEAVLTYCDGQSPVARVCQAAREELNISEDDARQALKQLVELGVLSPPPAHESGASPL